MTWVDSLGRRPVAAVSWSIAALLAGAWAALRVPLEWIPSLELPRVTISATWPGASPLMVERYVSAPIERLVQGVSGTVRVESRSEPGRSLVRLDVDERRDLSLYMVEVGDSLGLLRGTLPDSVRPVLSREVPEVLRDQQGFMTLQLVGPLSPESLRRLAERKLAPALRRLPGIAAVQVFGGSRRELLVTLLPNRLASYGVGPDEIRQRVIEAFGDVSFGRFRTRHGSLALIGPGIERREELAQLVVSRTEPGGAPVLLRDVATLTLGPAPRVSLSRVDGQPVVALVLDRAPETHLLGVAEEVHRQVRSLRGFLPPETRLLVATDRSARVRDQLRDLMVRGLAGVLLIVVVLVVMLRSFRAVAAAFFMVAVSLIPAVALLGPLGLTLNLLTLAGLVLVVGLLIDNSVVSVEQLLIQKAKSRHHPETRAAPGALAVKRSLRRVWLPLVGGTLSTIAALVPLVYLSGELRSLFLPFGILVSLTLGLSLVCIPLLLPVLEPWLSTPPRKKGRAWRGRLQRAIMAPYRCAARFPKATILASCLLLGIPTWLLPERLAEPTEGPKPALRAARLYNAVLGSEPVVGARQELDKILGGVTRPFLGGIRSGRRWGFAMRQDVVVRVALPPGSSPRQVDELIAVFERRARASQAVHRTLVRVTDRIGLLRVEFRDQTLDTVQPLLLREELIRQAQQLASVDVSVTGLVPEGFFSVRGVGTRGYLLEAFGSSYARLDGLIAEIAERLERHPRVHEVYAHAGRPGGDAPREALLLRWDAEAALRTGLATRDLAGFLRPRLIRRFPLLFADLDEDDSLPIRVTLGEKRPEVAVMASQPLRFGDAASWRLAEVAQFTVQRQPGAIERLNQQYRRFFQVDYRGPPPPRKPADRR